MMYYKPSSVLTCRGYKASIMAAPRLKGDHVHSLPPGTPIDAFEVDAFVNPDPSWVGGEGSWVVPVPADKGLWFDWRQNDSASTAVLPSVKGASPITGLPMTSIRMEQYKPGMPCPIHGCALDDRLKCPECGYEWPAQNYVVDPQGSTPSWWDGFRTGSDVRQFFFTEDMARDVASHLIGQENTVPAFGFAFFKRKSPFSRPGYVLTTWPPNPWGTTTNTLGLMNVSKTSGVDYNHVYCCSTSDTVTLQNCGNSSGPAVFDCMSTYKGDGTDKVSLKSWSKKKSMARGIDMSEGLDLDRSYSPAKEVAIGAGAKVDQKLPTDTSSLGDWGAEPDAVMRIYFVFEDAFHRIAAGGLRPTARSEGMLAGLPVG